MDTEKRPVLMGLVALVGVSVAIGLVAGLGVMMAVKTTGIGETSSTASDSSASATFTLPKPSETPTEQLQPQQTQEPGTAQPTAEPEAGISLSAAQQSVSPMQQIDLSGTYDGGDGSILQVQRLENDVWDDFPVTTSVSGSTFATIVRTGQIGPNQFRVVDTDTGVESNEVTVTVG